MDRMLLNRFLVFNSDTAHWFKMEEKIGESSQWEMPDSMVAE